MAENPKKQYILKLLIGLLSVVLTSAMVGVISIFLCGKAKTFKEAQSKVSFLSMISLVPMFTDMMNVNSNVLYMIPIASGGTILNDIFLKGVTMEGNSEKKFNTSNEKALF